MRAQGRIGAVVYDLRASGVVRNLLRIAGRARAEGLDFEIWPLRAQGEFLAEAQALAPVRAILPAPTQAQRDWDALVHHGAIARAAAQRAPALLFSPGNQMHWHIARALHRLPPQARPRLLGRASNAVVALGHAPGWARAAIRSQEAFQYRAMDHIVAVSDELRGQIVTGLGIPGERVSVIPNGIDAGALAAGGDAPRPHAAPLILGIGRLSVQKDFETLIDAVALIERDPAPVLRILGRGTDRWRTRLLRRAACRGLEGRFELPGHVADVAAHLRAADLFVSSSRWEGASNAVLEALACGTPIVATAAPTGIAEVLRPLGEELLVPVGDAPGLARAIARRLDAPRGGEALVARARDYDLATTLGGYAGLLADQLSRARLPRSDHA
jgi:glycosyltransferase involved in cell wall biosynthesis